MTTAPALICSNNTAYGRCVVQPHISRRNRCGSRRAAAIRSRYRVISVTENGVTVLASYTYDQRSRPTQVTLGNGVVTDIVWEADSDLDSLTHTFAGAQSVTFDYGYDRASRQVSNATSDATFVWSDATTDTEVVREN